MANKSTPQDISGQTEQWLDVINSWDGNDTTYASFSFILPQITIETPEQGEYFLADWKLTEAEAKEDYPEFGLTPYQKKNGYLRCKKWHNFSGFGGVDITAMTGQKIGSVKFPKIKEREKPEIHDFNITVKGKISGKNITQIILTLETESGQLLKFDNLPPMATTTLYVDIAPGATEWQTKLPTLEKPYFGLVSLVARAQVEIKVKGQNEPLKQILNTPFIRNFLLLGIQAGVADSDNDQARLIEDETLQVDFKDPSVKLPHEGGATSMDKFRTRRMHAFKTVNFSRQVRTKGADNKWTTENRSNSMMPELHLEIQILGLNQTGLDQLSTFAKEGKGSKAGKDILNFTAAWSGDIQFKGGAVRSPATSNTLKTYESKEDLDGKVKAKLYEVAPSNQYAAKKYRSSPYLSGFTHRPIQPPELEATSAQPHFSKRSWQNFNDDTIDQFQFESAVIPWQPVIGYWVDEQGKKVTPPIVRVNDGIYEPAAKDNQYYIQRIRCGDLNASATVTAFSKKYEFHIPTVRIQGDNPTKSDLLEVMNESVIKQLINTATTSTYRTEGSTSYSKKADLEKFFEVYGEQNWLDLCFAVIWHESASKLPGNSGPGNGSKIYHFKAKRSEYNQYIEGSYDQTSFETQHMPNFGAPAGWTLGQFDKPAVSDEDTLWDWSKAAVEMMKRITIDKLTNNAFSYKYDMSTSISGLNATALQTYTDYVGDPTKAAKQTNSSGAVWYSNKIRDGKEAIKALYDTNKTVREDAANMLAWLAMYRYNGAGARARKYPKKVGQDINLANQAPYFIGA